MSRERSFRESLADYCNAMVAFCDRDMRGEFPPRRATAKVVAKGNVLAHHNYYYENLKTWRAAWAMAEKQVREGCTL